MQQKYDIDALASIIRNGLPDYLEMYGVALIELIGNLKVIRYHFRNGNSEEALSSFFNFYGFTDEFLPEVNNGKPNAISTNRDREL